MTVLKSRLLPCLVVAIALAGCGGSDAPAPALKALQEAETYELLSLDPERQRAESLGPDSFYAWRVLGRTSVTDAATRNKLNNALRDGAREKDISPAACFEPRHGIRVTRGGKTTDLLICFACCQVRVLVDGQDGAGFLVSSSPQQVFDQVLQSKAVPLAGNTR